VPTSLVRGAKAVVERLSLMANCFVCETELDPGLRKGHWSYRHCGQCGLLSLEPLPSGDQIEEHYRTKFVAGNYELIRRYSRQYQRIHMQIADWISVRNGERVLDIGCFTGDLLKVLSDRGADVYGLELQQEAVDIANAQLGGGRVFHADVHGERFPTGPYDIVTMMGLIEHVLDPRALVRRVRTLLTANGRLYIETPNGGSTIARTMRSLWPPLAPVEHIHIFSVRALTLLLESEGFDVVRVRRHVKHLPVNYIYEQLANFGGPGWQRVMTPARLLLGNRTMPFYVGEMFVEASVKTPT
jgi:2-polyprenyl-3-methyl-5-hydroxy-6-metoxy-1,4-benzoquinol methylase